jgi:DNA-binding MarR family transcriptional regulator
MAKPGIEHPKPERELTDFLSYRIVRLHQALNNQATTLVDAIAGVSLIQWRVIAMVGSDTARTARELVRKSVIDPAVISRTVRGLEAAGIMESSRSDRDKRVLELNLTPSGQEIYQRTFPKMQMRQAALLVALDPSEQDVIFGILDKLEVAAEKRTHVA